MLQRIIDRTIPPRVAAAIGVLPLLPTLFCGLALDDFVHQFCARGHGLMSERGPLDLFRFMDGDAAHVTAMRDAGLVPWFAATDLRVAFFRPLSAFSHYLDYAVLRLPPWAMHLESIVWAFALVLIVAKLYARLLPSAKVAGLAALFYALDPGRGLPAGWLANRNGLMASTFAALALLFHHTWRKDAKAAYAFASTGAFALALASAEMGLGFLAYALAYALTLDRAATWPRRLATIVPTSIVAAAWQLSYRAGGFGARSSGFYVDPATSPLAFLRQLPAHAFALSGSELLTLPVEAAQRAKAAMGVAIVGALATTVFAWAIAPIVKRDPVARFFAIGAALAIVPVTGVMPASRVLLLVGIGGMGLLALLVNDVVARVETRPVARGLARFAGGVHVVLAPLLLTLGALSTSLLNAFLDASAPGIPPPTGLAGRTIVLLRTPSALAAEYRFMVPHENPLRRAVALVTVTADATDVTITRTDDGTLIAEAPGGMLNDPMAALYRNAPVPEDAPVRFGRWEATVTDPSGAARRARFRYDGSLDDPSLMWVTWDGRHFVELPAPRQGETLHLHDS